MKSMEIDTREWTDEMRLQAVKKLEDLGYKKGRECGFEALSITAHTYGVFTIYDVEPLIWREDLTPTFTELIAMTKEDVI